VFPLYDVGNGHTVCIRREEEVEPHVARDALARRPVSHCCVRASQSKRKQLPRPNSLTTARWPDLKKAGIEKLRGRRGEMWSHRRRAR
jgi:hypothetical protein